MNKLIILSSILCLNGCLNLPSPAEDNRPTPPIAKNRVKPIKVEQPCFPMRAVRLHAEGWVQVEFSLDNKGKAIQVTMLDNSPPGMFELCALNSIKNWVFELPKNYHAKDRYQFVFEFKLG